MPSKATKWTDLVGVRKTELGKGVFARKRFRKNQVVSEVRGTIIVDADYDSRYCIELSDTHVLEPGTPFRFLNHCCAPNCELYSWEPDERGDESHRVHLQALRTIEQGEELTIDYAWPADAAIPCRCAVETCRGWIVDLDELADLKRQAKPVDTRMRKRA